MREEINLIVSKRSRKGLVVLALISLGVISFPRFFFYFSSKDKISIRSFPQKRWLSSHRFKSYKSTHSYLERFNNKKNSFSIPVNKFDPNLYSLKDWIALGLSEKQANVILKFGTKGFYSNEDLKKVFVISNELFSLIKDSTFYPNRIFKDLAKNIEIKTVAKLVDANSASELDLVNLKGIGPFFAKQIIKKRNELGGFSDIQQLLEVWKMDVEKIAVFKDQIFIDPLLIHKISINNATMDELKIHPYIRWSVANSIVKMRFQKNGFKTLEEIKESVLINEELFEKLKPYLSL